VVENGEGIVKVRIPESSIKAKGKSLKGMLWVSKVSCFAFRVLLQRSRC